MEIPETGAVIVEIPAPLKSKKVTPNPTVPPSVLIPTPEITPVSADPSIAGRAPVSFDEVSVVILASATVPVN